MYSPKSHPHLLTLSLASLLGLAILGTPLFAFADDTLNLPNVGIPGRRVGGATRTPCLIKNPQPQKQFTAIVPENYIGTTVSELPTIFVYIPPNEAAGVEIGIEDEQGQPLYQIILKQKIASGLLSFDLSRQPEFQPLALNKTYKWYFQFICSFDEFNVASQNDAVEALVRRIPVSDVLNTQLQQVSSNNPAILYHHLANVYALEGIWYDRLTNLALSRVAKPNDVRVRNDWVNLLQQIGLSEFIHEPIHSLN